MSRDPRIRRVDIETGLLVFAGSRKQSDFFAHKNGIHHSKVFYFGGHNYGSLRCIRSSIYLSNWLLPMNKRVFLVGTWRRVKGKGKFEMLRNLESKGFELIEID